MPLLTKGFFQNEADELGEHFDKHVIRQKEFPHITTENEYLEEADLFLGGAKNTDTEEHIRTTDGALLRYNRKTNVFGVLGSDGYIRTYYKPSSGEKYFRRNCV